MNYYFIARLYDIKLSSILSRGKIIDGNCRISNGAENYKRIFFNEVFFDSIGSLETNALENSTYVYAVGKYSEQKKVFKQEYPPTVYLNHLMRKIQIFLNSLWLVKDNSVNLETGFMQVYPNNKPLAGMIHSNSCASSPTNCFGEYSETIFSPDEIDLAISYYNVFLKQDWELEESGDRLPSRNPFSKDSGRIGRAFYFLMMARSESVLPIKIIHYCSILECLFTSENTEVTHKVAERCARFLGDTFEARNELYILIKDLYKIRSKAVHGQVVKDNTDRMKEYLFQADNIARSIFVGYFITQEEKYKVFDYKQKEYEKWFSELILN